MPEDIADMSGRMLIQHVAQSGVGTTPAFWTPSADPKHPIDPVVAKIVKFVELDLQAAEQYGGAPSKQLLQLLDKVFRHKSATPDEDVQRAGELLVKDVKHKAPSIGEASRFLTAAEFSVIKEIIEHDPASASASKFVKGEADGRAAAKKTVAGTKYILGGIAGFLEEMLHEAVDEVKHIPPPPPPFSQPAAPPAGGVFDDRDSSLGTLGVMATQAPAPAKMPPAAKPRAPMPAWH